MKRAWGIGLVVSMFFLISTLAFADWPPEGSILSPGYIIINDSDPNILRSDKGNQYEDVHVSANPDGPGDKIEIALDSEGNLLGVLSYLGKPEKYSNPTSPLGDPSNGYCSSRHVDFGFDIKSGSLITANYKKNAAVFDILVWQDGSKTARRGTKIDKKNYFLTDSGVRAGIRWMKDVSGNVLMKDIVFSVEPSEYPCSNGCGLDAITQTNVDDFSPKDTNADYRDARDAYGEGNCDLIPYFMVYSDPFTVTNIVGGKWIISGGGTAYLYVIDSSDRWIPLAGYKNLPFEITVSTSPIVSPAPSKQRTATILWGDIKSD